MYPCTNSKDRDKLIETIQTENEYYSRETIEKAINSCCKENNTEIVKCVRERAKQFHLIDFKK